MATPEARELRFLGLGINQVIRQLPLLLPGERPTTPIDNLRFSPDGTRLAIANGDGPSVDIVNVASGQRLIHFPTYGALDDEGMHFSLVLARSAATWPSISSPPRIAAVAKGSC